MNLLVSAMLVVIAIIHLLPLAGVLGVFFLGAAVRPALQPLAFVVAFVSIVSFLWLAWSTGGYNARVGRVVTADIVALVCLAIAIVARMYAVSRG